MRALDDLHTLATSSARLAKAVDELPRMEGRLRDRLDSLDKAMGSLAQLGEDTRRTVDQMRALQEAVLNLIRSTDTLTLAIQPLEAFGRRMGRFADRLPGRGGADRGASAQG
jgi:ABC-type transporter Mla subunit MlaD